MNIEEIRVWCLGKKGVTEDMPFGEDTLVFRVMGKIFLLVNLEGETRVNIKCDPEKAVELREEYEAVLPGYHMNKKHWNSIIVPAVPSRELFRSWIDHSYDLVRGSLTRKQKEKLGDL